MAARDGERGTEQGETHQTKLPFTLCIGRRLTGVDAERSRADYIALIRRRKRAAN
jgi:uncharacterized protein YifE (UPF0438 family)